MQRDWRHLTLGLVGLAMLGGVTVPVALYALGNWTAPETPIAVTAPLPPLVRAAIWARAGGTGEPHVEPLTPWTILGFITCHVAAERLPEASATDEHARCLADQAGVHVAGQVSRLYTTTLLSTPRYPLSNIAMMARLTRTWDIDRLLSTAAAKSLFSRQKWIGIDQASQALFGKRPPQLAAAEAALLSVQMITAETPNGRAQDPWCHADRALSGRDVVLRKMNDNGALPVGSLESAINAPLGVLPGECPPR